MSVKRLITKKERQNLKNRKEIMDSIFNKLRLLNFTEKEIEILLRKK